MDSAKKSFATTRWTMVRDASGATSVASTKALEELCNAYWFPLYTYVRRLGRSKEEAEDLTQGFFMYLLSRSDFTDLNRKEGKFRSFLLASLKHYISNDNDKKRTKKRGGTITHFSLDWESADAKYQLIDTTTLSPDSAYDREWATALLERVIISLEENATRKGRHKEFAQLKQFLTSERGEIPYEKAAAEIGVTATALRVSVHRLRKHYRDLLKAEVSNTISPDESVMDEIATLLGGFTT